jgi:serine/threonine protein kinase
MGEIIGDRFKLTDGTPRSGHFADVYKAYDLKAELPTAVAIKFLKPEKTEDLVAIATVHREYASLLKLDHPNIVRLIDAGVDAESHKHYLALEWVESNLATTRSRVVLPAPFSPTIPPRSP